MGRQGHGSDGDRRYFGVAMGRGVNVFPSGLREVVAEFVPEVSGIIMVKPRAAGVRQEPPLPVSVEMAQARTAGAQLAHRIGQRIREKLIVAAEVDLVPWGS